MTTIAIVQCGMVKLARSARAEDLYVGSFFRLLREVALAISDRWYIASAKHGLVSPSKPIAPYDTSLPLGGDREWGKRVLEAIERERSQIELPHRFVALCSKRYCLVWADAVKAERPIDGLRIGMARTKLCEMRRTR